MDQTWIGIIDFDGYYVLKFPKLDDTGKPTDDGVFFTLRGDRLATLIEFLTESSSKGD